LVWNLLTGQIKSKKIKVQIQKAPQLKKKPEAIITVKEGEQARFECEFDGNPSPKVSWLRDGKPLTAKDGFEIKTGQSPQSLLNSTSILRRRFSLFRIKRPQQQQQQSSMNDIQNESSNVEALQQIIAQLRRDLQMKTDELETMRERIEKKRSSIAVPSNETIGQAMQLQTMLNARLEEMLIENDLLKKSIQELEAFAEQQRCK